MRRVVDGMEVRCPAGMGGGTGGGAKLGVEPGTWKLERLVMGRGGGRLREKAGRTPEELIAVRAMGRIRLARNEWVTMAAAAAAAGDCEL
jgi:hypothetical protein